MNFVANIEQAAAQLRDIGVVVDDKQIMGKILFSLPPSLQYFLPAWDSTPREFKTLSFLTKRLVKEENALLRNKEKKVEPVDTAFYGASQQPIPVDTVQELDGFGQMQYAYPAGGYPGLRGGFNNSQRGQRGRGDYRGRGGYHQRGGYHPYQNNSRDDQQYTGNYSRGGHQQSQIICYNCGEVGHIKRKCRHLKREMENQQTANQSEGQQQSYSYKSSTCFIARRYCLTDSYCQLILTWLYILKKKGQEIGLLIRGQLST